MQSGRTAGRLANPGLTAYFYSYAARPGIQRLNE